MPERHESRARAHLEKLQAHAQSDGTFVVYNPTRHTQYVVRPFPHSRPDAPAFYCECPWATRGSPARNGYCKHVQRVLDKITNEHLRCYGCNTRVSKPTLLKDHKCAQCRAEDRMRTKEIQHA
jgi:hypothetical protein